MAFIDDTATSNKNLPEYLIYLQKALTIFQKADSVVKANKCQFGFPEVTYLGHRVGSGEKNHHYGTE